MRKLAFLNCAVLLLILNVNQSFADGLEIHSLDALLENVQEHIIVTEVTYEEESESSRAVKKLAQHLQLHAEEYKKFAKDMLRKNNDVMTSQAIDRRSDQLIIAADRFDIEKCLEILEQIFAVVQTAME